MEIRAIHWWTAVSVAAAAHVFALLWLSQPRARIDPPMVSTGIVIALEDKLAQRREHAASLPQPAESISDVTSELTRPRDTIDAVHPRPATAAPSASLPEPAQAVVTEASQALSAPSPVSEQPPLPAVTEPKVPAAASVPIPQAMAAASDATRIAHDAGRVAADIPTAGPPAAMTSLQLEAIHPQATTGEDVTPLKPASAARSELDELTPTVPQAAPIVAEPDAAETRPLTPAEDVVARAVPAPISPVTQREVLGVTAQYAGVLKGWLQRNMRYPRDAWLEGQQGTTVVQFTIDRDGAVVTSHLERGSGHKLLDSEAMQMVRRADPFPSMPPEIVGNELELRVPIVFYIKDYERQREMPPIYLR